MAKDHIVDYTVVAGDMGDIDGVNVAEGTAPSNINNAIREMARDISEFYQDTGGGISSGGAAGAYTLTTKDSVAAYVQGQMYAFEANHAMPDTATATLNINAIGAKPLRKNVSVALAAADIKINQLCVVAYEGTNDVFHLMSSGGQRSVVQRLVTQSGAVATGTGTIAYDDTIPQLSSDGTEFLTRAITPASIANTLEIEVVFVFAQANATANVQLGALFQDATEDALAATQMHVSSTNELGIMTLKHSMAAGTTSSITFKFHSGDLNGGVTTMNGQGAARKFGGVMASSITVTEYAA